MNKPTHVLDQFGDDVRVNVKKLDRDVWSETTMQEIGKQFAPEGTKYAGSFAVHTYISESEFAAEQQFAFASQTVGIENISAGIAMASVVALDKKLQSIYTTKRDNAEKWQGKKDDKGNLNRK